MLTIDGLISGIDTEKVIEGLLDIQRKRVDLFEQQRTKVQTKQAAIKAFEGALAGFRSTASRLGRFQNNVFDQRVVEVSNEDRIAATAKSSATPGIYTLTVDTLARAHQVSSQSFTSANAEITQGTIDLRLGQQSDSTVTIDSTNNTVQGLVDAINDANTGVSAALINDGQTGGVRVLLSSNQSGADGAITLTNNLGASAGSAVQPTFDFGNPVQAAQDATVRLGSGAGAITISSATNTITDAVPGLTLNLKQADPSTELTVVVSADTSSAVEAVEDFVNGYNSLLDTISALTKFDPETNESGVLIGDRSVIDIANSLRESVLGSVSGLPTNANRLSRLGISVGDTGKLTLNSSRLEDVLSGRDPAIGIADARRIFGLDAVSTNPSVRFILGSTRTQASTTPYGINVTRAAEQASLTAGNTLAASTTIDGTSDTLDLTVDGASISVTLAHGDYTRTELADLVHGAVNAHPDLIGRGVLVNLEGDALHVTSESYGTASSLNISGGTALAALGFTGGESDVGVDVAGEFIVDGVSEAATGKGRLLVGGIDNKNTADLQVQVSLSAGQLGAGNEAELSVTKGVGGKLDALLNKVLSADTGRLAAINDRYTQELDSLGTTIDRQNALFEKQQERLISQFVALESALAGLQSTSSLLGSQLASLTSLSGNR